MWQLAVLQSVVRFSDKYTDRNLIYTEKEKKNTSLRNDSDYLSYFMTSHH